MAIWDEGEYGVADGDAEEQWKRGSLSFELRGRILKGAFSLVRMSQGETGKEWLLIKRKDRYARGDWKLRSVLTPQKLSQLKKERPPCPME